MCLGLGHGAAHHRQVPGPPIEGGQPRTQPVGEPAQIIGKHGVLARQRADCKQPLFHPLQIGRVEIQPAQRGLDACLCLAQFGQGPAKRRQRPVQCAIRAACRRIQPALRIDHQPFGTFV